MVAGNLLGARRQPACSPVLLGIAVYIFLMPFAARLPVNYPWVYACVLALPILANLLALRASFQDLAARRDASSAPGANVWVSRRFLFVLITHWFAMLKPEASADGLSMHLAVPANIAANHMMTFDPARYLWAVMPMGADFTYSIVYMLGGEMAARLLNFVILLVLLGLLHAAVRRWVSPGVAWLLVALFATTPMVQLVTGSLFVENLLAAFLLGMMTALWRFGESGRAPFSVPGGSARRHRDGDQIRRDRHSCARDRLRRGRNVAPHRKQTGARWALAAGLLLLDRRSALRHRLDQDRQPALPVCQRPIPLAATRSQGRHSGTTRFADPLTWNTPYDLTFRTTRYYEGQYGSFGFQYLVLAPLALLALLVAPRRQAVVAAVVASSGDSADSRYGTQRALSLPRAALAVRAVRRAARRGPAPTSARWLARCSRLRLPAPPLNVYFLPGSSYYHKDFYGPFTTAPARSVHRA